MNLDMTKESRQITLARNTWFKVTLAEATKLAHEGPNGKLPRPGYECKVTVNGCPCWLCRTMDIGKVVWSVRAQSGYELPKEVKS